MSIGDLANQAREFAEDQSELLNRTVANGVRLGHTVRTGRAAFVGLGVSNKQWAGQPIPLTLSAAAPRTFLLVHHVMRLDDEQMYLTDGRTNYGIYLDQEGERELVRYDYIRDNHHHPEAHVHIDGEFRHGTPNGVRPPRKLHLPVGGRRFRPSLEDVVEFVIREKFAEGLDGWEDAVEEHRQRWHERQLRAAVRRAPDIAVDQLRRDGKIP